MVKVKKEKNGGGKKRKRKTEGKKAKKKLKRVSGKIKAKPAEVKKEMSTKPGDYAIPEQVLKILEREEITDLFPIQYKTFDLVYNGSDIVGKAYTGSGKTLAFVLPTISQLMEKKIKAGRREGCSVICLSPTRELCMQIAKVFETYAVGLNVASVYGGSSYERQIRALERGADIVVGTCGRVKDMIEKGHLKLDRCRFVILDEADEMLNMGFEEDVESILSNLNKAEITVQTLLFSATIPEWINTLIEKYLREERRLVDLVSNQVQQSSRDVEHMAICCHWQEREEVLADILLTQVKSDDLVMIFCEMKKDCNELVVSEWIKQECQCLHGDIVQKQREITTEGYRNGRFPVLICTDVAARGLDIKDVKLIIQLEPPGDAETYIHRSGRTGRAGKKGKSIMFYTLKKQHLMKNIEKKMGSKFKRIGAPQREDIARTVASHSAEKIKAIPEEITDVFRPMAEELLKEVDPQVALANAFALISGYTSESVNRSVLSCSRGYTTLMCVTDQEIRNAGYVFNQMEQLFDYDLRQNVRGMTLLKTKLGAVFDCPEKRVDEVIATDKPWIKFQRVTEIPELELKGAFSSMGRSRGRLSSRGGSRGGYSSRGNYSSRGGYSRGGGYGGRGGGYSRGGYRSNRGGRSRGSFSGGRGRGRYSRGSRGRGYGR